MVRYEVLKANPEAAIRPVLADLGLEFEDSVLEQCYPANTSFASDEERKTAMSWLEVGAAKTMALMLQAVPVSWLRALERRRQAQRGVVWPEWVWRRRDKGTAR